MDDVIGSSSRRFRIGPEAGGLIEPFGAWLHRGICPMRIRATRACRKIREAVNAGFRGYVRQVCGTRNGGG